MLKLKYTHILQMIVVAIFISILWTGYAHAIDEDQSTAVIFVYQRVGEDSVPQSNISVDQLKEHIKELGKDGYSVLPVPKIISALETGMALPPKTVGITFEGAYQTTLFNAIPLLEEAHMPFTVFFASDMPDSNNPTHMSWDQIKKLKKNKLASLGILPAAYVHMTNQTAEQNAAILNRAQARYREMLEEEPLFFAYPYGEYNVELKKQLASYKFKAIFGQHSGSVHAHSDFMALPRFTMTDDYGGLDRFMLTANALPLPVTDIVPEDAVLTQNPPTIGFTVTPEISNLSKLSCFASGMGKLPLTRIGGNRVEIRTTEPFIDRRTRINCTLPNDADTPGEAPRWRWFGMMLISPTLEEDSGPDPDPQAPEEPENQ